MSILMMLSFPIAFLVHDMEEILVQHKWMSAHKEDLAVHVGQGIIIRGYVPGLITSILLLPYAYYIICCICQVIDFGKLFHLGVIGFVAIAVNLLFAHWLGNKFK